MSWSAKQRLTMAVTMLPSSARMVRPSICERALHVAPRVSGPRAVPPRASTMVGAKLGDVAGPTRAGVRCCAEGATTSSPASALAAPSLPIGTPDAAEKERLQKLYDLLKTDAKKVGRGRKISGCMHVSVESR